MIVAEEKIHQGLEINLTDLSSYTWCPNLPVMLVSEKIRLGYEWSVIKGEVEMYNYVETYPRILIADDGIFFNTGGYTPFYINSRNYNNFFYKEGENFELSSDKFSKYKFELEHCLNREDWKRLTRLMGNIAEQEYSIAYRKDGVKNQLLTYYGDFIINTVPDGIFGDTIYEFKTEQYSDKIDKQFKIGEFQADLISYLFGYNKIHVEVLDFNTLKLYENKRVADYNKAEEVLDDIFDRIDNNTLRKLPKDSKCNNCKFINVCPR